MTDEEAKRLLIQTVVMWNGDKADLGTVLQLSTWGFYVAWANGQRGWIGYQDAKKITVRQKVIASLASRG